MPTIKIIDDNTVQFLDADGNLLAEQRYADADTALEIVDGDDNPLPIDTGPIQTPSVSTDDVFTVPPGDGADGIKTAVAESVKIQLGDGVYTVTEEIAPLASNLIIEGNGDSTTLRIPDGTVASGEEFHVIRDESGTVSNITVRNLEIDCNYQNQSGYVTGLRIENDGSGVVTFDNVTVGSSNRISHVIRGKGVGIIRDCRAETFGNQGPSVSMKGDDDDASTGVYGFGLITGCVVENGHVPGGDSWCHAILGEGVDRVRVSDNHVRDLPATTSGSSVVAYQCSLSRHVEVVGNSVDWVQTADSGATVRGVEHITDDRVQADTVLVADNTIVGASEGIAVYSPNDTYTPQSVRIAGNVLREQQLKGIHTARIDTSPQVAENHIDAPDAGRGIDCLASTEPDISSNTVKGAGTSGIRANNSTDSAIIRGNTVEGCYRAFELSDATEPQLRGNTVRNTGNKTVYIVAGGVTDAVATGNDFRDGVSSVTDDSVFRTLDNNEGYNSEDSGLATLSGGTTSVTVSTNVSATYSYGDVQVTPIGDLEGASFRVTNLDQNSFDIVVSSAPSTDSDLSWSVDR
jgi:parallel beta-helix repeat protein